MNKPDKISDGINLEKHRHRHTIGDGGLCVCAMPLCALSHPHFPSQKQSWSDCSSRSKKSCPEVSYLPPLHLPSPFLFVISVNFQRRFRCRLFCFWIYLASLMFENFLQLFASSELIFLRYTILLIHLFFWNFLIYSNIALLRLLFYCTVVIVWLSNIRIFFFRNLK